MNARKQKRSPKSPRRKAGSKAKVTRKQTFRITVEAQEVAVTYTPNSFGEGDYPHGQFEFRSPHRPPKRIAISETGYYCHVAPMEDVLAAESPQAYARELVLDHLDRERRAKRGYDSRQMSLI